jgi:tRNA A37 methylthiotransferase MiaB
MKKNIESEKKSKKIYIEAYGCALNLSDYEKLSNLILIMV